MRFPIVKVLLVSALLINPAFAGENETIEKSNSGFLSDYSQLKPAKNGEGVLIHFKEGIDLSTSNKVRFMPVEVILAPNPDYAGVQPEVLKRMTDGLLNSFRDALGGSYQFVNQPGPDVMTIRLAITGVQAVRPSLKPLDFVPLKALYNVGRNAAGYAPKVAEMSAEMEVLNNSGETVIAAIATRKGKTTLPQGEEITWKDLQEITDFWAQGFRKRLDQARDVR